MALFDQKLRYLAASEAWMRRYEAGRTNVRGQEYHYETQSGRHRDQIIGRTVDEVIDAEILSHAMPRICEALAGRSQSYELRGRMPDGLEHVFQVELVPEFGPVGRVIGYFAITVDKTDQVRIDAELGRMRDRLEQFTRRQVAQQTVMAIAHELRQPLHAAENFLAAIPVMQTQGKPRSEVIRILGRAGDEIQRANRVVTQLFDFVREDRAPPRDTCIRLAMNDVIQTALTRFRSDHSAALTCAKLDLCADSGDLACDPIMVEKVVMNLLRNATEAIGCGATCKPGSRILLQTRREGRKIRLSVEDNGGGVAETARPHLFQPFRSTKPGGLGLGLSICRQLVELQGGQIWHEDRPGGSAFCVDLPVAP